MNTPACPNCDLAVYPLAKMRRHGFYFRTSDEAFVQRFRCTECKKTQSFATFDYRVRQKKRFKNSRIVELLCSGVSQRRAARLEKINRKTVARILSLESLRAECSLRTENLAGDKATVVQFDDMETFEHSKCKPLSISLAVEEKTRRILGVELALMPSRGPLAATSRKRYGFRPDERRIARTKLLLRSKGFLSAELILKSDQNPHYPSIVKKCLPNARHVTYKGKRGAIGGQGELKKVRFDPLFSLNHTCAMFRANVNRLFRKTWCTTKRASCLYEHLVLYAEYHNRHLVTPAA